MNPASHALCLLTRKWVVLVRSLRRSSEYRFRFNFVACNVCLKCADILDISYVNVTPIRQSPPRVNMRQKKNISHFALWHNLTCDKRHVTNVILVNLTCYVHDFFTINATWLLFGKTIWIRYYICRFAISVNVNKNKHWRRATWNNKQYWMTKFCL